MLISNPQKPFCYRYFILPLFILFQLPAYLFAQTNSVTKQSSPIVWKLTVTVQGVKFYHSLTECSGKKVVFLKFDNTNPYNVEVSWKEVFTTQNESQIEGYSGQKTIIAKVGETMETNCITPSQKELLILPGQVNPTYIANVSKFEFKEINVAKIN